MAVEALQSVGSNVVAMPTPAQAAATTSPTVTETDFKQGGQAQAYNNMPQAAVYDKSQTAEGENKEDIKKAAADFSKNISAGSEAVFGIHEKTNRVTIKIVDKESKEVLRELPAEKTLDMIAKVWELAGLLVDEKR